jgi:arylsulfatase A-like enzyme
VFFPWSTGSLPPSEITLAQALKPKNYTTAIIGKWHLGHVNALPRQRGFDYFYGLPYSQDEGCPPGLNMPCDSEIEKIWPPSKFYDYSL